jgi:hypothetical protein
MDKKRWSLASFGGLVGVTMELEESRWWYKSRSGYLYSELLYDMCNLKKLRR